MSPASDSLAIDCDLKCDMCKESVNYGDDYVAHLQFAHSVTQNIPFFMKKALDQIKGEKKRKIDAVVTLEEESSTDEVGSGMISDATPSSETFLLDDNTKQRIEKTVEKTMDELFKGIKLMVEGKVPLEDYDASNLDDADTDPNTADERIWQSFEDLKETVNNIEFPPELLRQLAAPVIESNEGIGSISVPSASENIGPIFEKEDMSRKNKRPSIQNQNHRDETNKSHKTSRSKSPVAMSLSSQSQFSSFNDSISSSVESEPTGSQHLDPVKTDRSDNSSSSRSGQTFFICPLSQCNFFTTKQGMRDGAAANHLNKAHKITGSDMKNASPGTYKFNKVKGEPKII